MLHFFDKASIHTRDMLKNTIFSLNKENHFPHYHACSVSIKNQSSNACFQVLLVKLPIYAYSLAQQKFTQHHSLHYYNFVHFVKCFKLRGWEELRKFTHASMKHLLFKSIVVGCHSKPSFLKRKKNYIISVVFQSNKGLIDPTD